MQVPCWSIQSRLPSKQGVPPPQEITRSSLKLIFLNDSASFFRKTSSECPEIQWAGEVPVSLRIWISRSTNLKFSLLAIFFPSVLLPLPGNPQMKRSCGTCQFIFFLFLPSLNAQVVKLVDTLLWGGSELSLCKFESCPGHLVNSRKLLSGCFIFSIFRIQGIQHILRDI